MLEALRVSSFRNLWLGGAISAIGDMALLIALPFHVYNLTGSTLATGGTFLAQTLPRLLLGSVAGVFADRWDRKRTMIVVDLSRAVVLLPLMLVQNAEWVWVVYVVAVVKATLTQFFGPAHSAILPRLVGEKLLVSANSLVSVSDSSVRLIAPALGGALLAFSGISAVVLIDVASYLMSALLIGSIALSQDQRGGPANQAAELGEMGTRRFVDEWLFGLKILWGDRLLASLVLVSGVAMVGQGLINVLLVPFVREILAGSSMEFGWLVTIQGVGGVLGGVMMGHLGHRAVSLRVISLALAVVGALFLTMVSFPSLLFSLTLIGLVGLPSAMYTIGVQTLLQTHVRDEYRGRIFGAYGSFIVLMLMIGMGFASIFGDRVPLQGILTFSAAMFLLAAIVGGSMKSSEDRVLTEPSKTS